MNEKLPRLLTAQEVLGELRSISSAVNDAALSKLAQNSGVAIFPVGKDPHASTAQGTLPAFSAADSPLENITPQKSKKNWRDTLLYMGLGLFLCAVVVYSISLCLPSKENTSFFGFSFFRVVSGSMNSELPAGSAIITYRIKPENLKIGDNITYTLKRGAQDTTYITHKIIDILYDDDGIAFKTMGIENMVSDSELVRPEQVVGKVIFCSRLLGLNPVFFAVAIPVLLFGICLFFVFVFIFLRERKVRGKARL